MSIDHDELIRRTAEHVRRTLDGEPSGHDWWHVYRVWKSAQAIARAEGADGFVVELAALLHDLSDRKLNGGDVTLGPKWPASGSRHRGSRRRSWSTWARSSPTCRSKARACPRPCAPWRGRW